MSDLTGRTFGRLTIIGPAPATIPLPPTRDWWLATCLCGEELIAPAEAFTSGRVTSCGRPGPEQRQQHDEPEAAEGQATAEGKRGDNGRHRGYPLGMANFRLDHRNAGP